MLMLTVRNCIVEVAGSMRRRLVLAVQSRMDQRSTASASSDQVPDHGTKYQKCHHADQHNRNDDAKSHVTLILVFIYQPHQ